VYVALPMRLKVPALGPSYWCSSRTFPVVTYLGLTAGKKPAFSRFCSVNTTMHNTRLRGRFDPMHFRAVVLGHEVDHGSKEAYLARPGLNYLGTIRGACATI
jgi:hypothetical protein